MKKSAFTLFKENNPSILVQNANGSFVIKNCWGENAFIFNFPTKHSMLCLKNTIFPKELFIVSASIFAVPLGLSIFLL